MPDAAGHPPSSVVPRERSAAARRWSAWTAAIALAATVTACHPFRDCRRAAALARWDVAEAELEADAGPPGRGAARHRARYALYRGLVALGAGDSRVARAWLTLADMERGRLRPEERVRLALARRALGLAPTDALPRAPSKA